MISNRINAVSCYLISTLQGLMALAILHKDGIAGDNYHIYLALLFLHVGNQLWSKR